MRDAADQIRTEVLNLSDDLGRLRDRVLKLQKHFGDVNEDVRQILISADKIEKRAGRIENWTSARPTPHRAAAPRQASPARPVPATAANCRRGSRVLRRHTLHRHRRLDRATQIPENGDSAASRLHSRQQHRRTLYIGVTNDLIRRVGEHKLKIAESFTKRHEVTRLLYFEIFDQIEHAIHREKRLKNGHGPGRFAHRKGQSELDRSLPTDCRRRRIGLWNAGSPGQAGR